MKPLFSGAGRVIGFDEDLGTVEIECEFSVSTFDIGCCMEHLQIGDDASIWETDEGWAVTGKNVDLSKPSTNIKVQVSPGLRKEGKERPYMVYTSVAQILWEECLKLSQMDEDE